MKPGRRTEHLVEPTTPRTYSLDDLTVTMLKALGDGNASKGIRRAARFTYDCYQAGSFTTSTKTSVPVVPTPPKA